MSKEIIVNVDSRETRVAIIESGKLVELHVEREERVVGSTYKCKVANVLPGMDAAFVDIGLERNAFLYVGDVIPEADEDYPGVKGEVARSINIKDILNVHQELLFRWSKGHVDRRALAFPRGYPCRASTWCLCLKRTISAYRARSRMGRNATD